MQPEIYLVGGAVRDHLMNIPAKDKDYVVVGATSEWMLSQGFIPIGKDFPIFLHPETKEEYALARTECKTGKGYTAFSIDAHPNITLEEDLSRRDLTINAMALSLSGILIDPFNGQADLQQGILRHVSPAFAEDPVRILRIARFSARYDFTIAPSTLQLMQQMVMAGEVDALVAERVWEELKKGIMEQHPLNLFDVLNCCNALERLIPELIQAIHTSSWRQLVQQIPQIPSLTGRMALLLTPLSAQDALHFCQRYKLPIHIKESILLLITMCSFIKDNENRMLSPVRILNALLKTDAIRRSARFTEMLSWLSLWGQCQFPPMETHIGLWQTAQKALLNIDTAKVIANLEQSVSIQDKIYNTRLNKIEEIFQDYL